MLPPPFFSLIIPVHNGGPLLARCLEAVCASSFRDWELIVVDDASTDGSAETARRYGARTLTLDRQSGPAAARNAGAAIARGRYLFFTDSDCQLHADALARAAAILQTPPELDALIGSYDAEPAAPNLVSQYKNLLHHYVHQTSRPQAQTFWGGCGALRRVRFDALGGFDAQRYPRPSIEDIELGYRLIAAGGRIHLAKGVQVKHLKRWTLISLLRSDIGDRALPWSRLLQQRGAVPADLNLQAHHRLSAGTLFVAIGAAGLAIHRRRAAVVSLFSAGALVWLNRDLYTFFRRRRGLLFTLGAIPLHWLYYAYSAIIFAAVWLVTRLQAGQKPRP